MRWFAAMVLGLVAAACPGRDALAQSLNGEVRSVLTAAKLGPVQVGVCLIDADSGVMLAGIDERQPMTPASNLKLLTSGSALMALGKGFEFKTRFVRDGDRLVIIGDGDPGLADPKLLAEMKLSLEGFIDQVVGEIASRTGKGIREVVVDDRVFDREYIHPSWPKNQLDRWYCASVSGLNFFTNVLEIYVTPSPKRDAPPLVRTVPSAPWLEIRNNARTAGDSTSLGASRAPDRNLFTLSGTIAAKMKPEEPFEVTTWEPGLMLARLVADRLGAAGLGLDGSAGAGREVPGVRLVASDEQYKADQTLAIVKTPLTVALSRCNVNSQNLYAESLLKRSGHAVSGQPGSWSNGAALIRMQVSERLGSDASELVIVDGSGLSRENRVSPHLLASWLAMIHRDKELGPIFVDSMANEESGKLEKRFKGRKLINEVRGKTGYIEGVQCLSGYVTQRETGRSIVYVVMVNHTTAAAPGAQVKEFHEDVVQVVDRYLGKAGKGASKPG